MLELGRKILASQPFSVFLGAELTDLSAGKAELRIPIRPEFGQQHGFAHGGIVSYAADNALTFAGGSVLGTGVVTSEFKINYLRPALGESLVARASVIHHGKRQAVCRCDILVSDNDQETPCAAAQGTIVSFSTRAR